MHNEQKAKETLEWCLVLGRGDEKFIAKRNDMISAAGGTDATAFLAATQEMLKHDQPAFDNLTAADTEKPGSPLKWARVMLNLGS